MKFVDTHCHIHEDDYPLDRVEVLKNAANAGVTEIFCVGTDIKSSQDAIQFANEFDEKFGVKISATIGVHPHEVKDLVEADYDVLSNLVNCAQDSLPSKIKNGQISGPFLHEKTVLCAKLAGIGEIGLDYFYEFSPREVQIKALERQLQIASDHNLPVSFHVRDGAKNSHSAFVDFWSIIANFPKIRGVMHSFTDTRDNLNRALNNGFFIGVNGIITFNKDPDQTAMYRAIPLDRILLETDTPFLSPKPFRGKPNQPSRIREIAEFLAEFMNVPVEKIAEQTTKNARAFLSNQ
ncbi:TatD family hydrolase [Candidatus Saccharibacteria bacterium]|nr:TatD family hydrolase [Candidatus Saccharibacteria bacterium]MCL1962948.1 TatD family hydrolase [Candidatus Saccharibacteria bacterium]